MITGPIADFGFKINRGNTIIHTNHIPIEIHQALALEYLMDHLLIGKHPKQSNNPHNNIDHRHLHII